MLTKERKQFTGAVTLGDLGLPPQAIDVEKSLLGAIIYNQNVLSTIVDAVSSNDFYKKEHREIFSTIIEMYEKNLPVDVVTLTEMLESKKLLKVVGGASSVAALPAGASNSYHALAYAKIVRDKAILRRLIAAGSEIAAKGYEEDRPLEDILDESEQKLFGVTQKAVRQQFEELKEILVRSFDRIDELHREKGKTRGVPTGYGDLDSILSGFQQSDLIILAARPSMGKTAFALNIAQNVALKYKKSVGVFSLEMSKDQLTDRLISGEAGVDSWKLRTGNLANADFERLTIAMGRLAEARIFIDDDAGSNVLEIRSKARRLKSEHGLDLIVVDYLQLIQGRQTSGDSNRVQEIAEISRGLKALAKELEVPVVALSQLSRAVESRPNKIPMLSDLRESGSIEQDADVVMFLYREDYYEPDTENKGLTKVLIRKHRNGPIGEVDLMFVPEQTKFMSVDKRRS